MPKMLNLCFFLIIFIFRFTHNSFFSSFWHPYFRFQTGIATSLSVIEQNFFCSSQIYVLALCTQNFVILDEKLWPRQSCKVYFFSLKKLFFGTQLLSAAETIIFHLGSQKKFGVHNLNTYTYPKKKILYSSTLREVAISI